MRLQVVLSFAIAALCTVAHYVVPDDKNARELFEQFKQKYQKNYVNEDEHKRFAIFKDNLKRAAEHQAVDQGTAKYGITQFSDLTTEEFQSMYANSHFDESVEQVRSIEIENMNVPASFDWRDHGAVGPVLDQGACGSCWAFSVVGNIEGQWFMKTGNLLSLSVQELLDCDDIDFGCAGGNPLRTYGEIERFGGLESSADYPYQADGSKCALHPEKIKAYVNNSILLDLNEKKQAAWLVKNGPIAAALNSTSLRHYDSGIIHPPPSECSFWKLNHAVLIVGYGTESGTPYWIVKNSWGPSFGEKGYFRIYRGDGTCGINIMSTSAVIH